MHDRVTFLLLDAVMGWGRHGGPGLWGCSLYTWEERGFHHPAPL